MRVKRKLAVQSKNQNRQREAHTQREKHTTNMSTQTAEQVRFICFVYNSLSPRTLHISHELATHAIRAYQKISNYASCRVNILPEVEYFVLNRAVRVGETLSMHKIITINHLKVRFYAFESFFAITF